MLYVPLESVITTWIGESERNLGRVFSHANMLPNGAIIFLDEVLESFIAYSTPSVYLLTSLYFFLFPLFLFLFFYAPSVLYLMLRLQLMLFSFLVI